MRPLQATKRIIRERQQRAHEPLARLIGFAAANAIDPFRGAFGDPAILDHAELAVRGELERMADAGVFIYFGIADRYELDVLRLSCEVRMLWARECPTCQRLPWAASQHARRCGHVTVDAYTIASEIIHGPAREGWVPAGKITAADLG